MFTTRTSMKSVKITRIADKRSVQEGYIFWLGWGDYSGKYTPPQSVQADGKI